MPKKTRLTLNCPTCKNPFFSHRGSRYCSRKCSWSRPRDNDREPMKAVSPDYNVSTIIESGVASNSEIGHFVERVVPGLPVNTKDQLVMFVSILRGKGFEIVNCNEKSLAQLVELVKNQTDSLLKEASQ